MRRHRRIIFLDIDGVLGNPKSRALGGMFAFDPEAVTRLRRIVLRHHAKIVISSSWRFLPDWQELIRAACTECGWDNPPIVGVTPNIPGIRMRGREIQAWLNANPTESFVILDDDNDMLEEQISVFVRCSFERGLTDREVEAVSRIWA